MNSAAPTNPIREKDRLLGYVFALFGVIAPAATLIARKSLPNFRYEDPALHSAIEAMGAIVAVITGVMISILQRQFLWTEKFRWASCSLISMGILSGIHSFFGQESHVLVSLELASDFCGAFFAALCWLPTGKRFVTKNFQLEWMVAVGAVFSGALVLTIPDLLPPVLNDQKFSLFSGLISSLSTVLFLGASFKFFHDFRADQKSKNLFMGAFFLLSGVSSIFPVSFYPWGPLWWSWHVLKLTGYFAALSLVASIAIRLERQLEESERRTHELLEQAVKDIAARKRHEAEIQALTESLTRSNEDLRRFGHILSHDMQQPLRMITSYLALLKRELEGKLEEKELEFMGFAVKGAKQLQSLIVALLKYSELEKTGKGIELESVDLNIVVHNVLSIIGPLIHETKAKVECEKLPLVVSHPVLLTTVLQNLVVNAIKYRSERPTSIRINAETHPSEFVISIADNGIGIEPQFQDCIFEPLRRLHGPEIEGTGMGLASTKRIIERLGGRIWLASTPGVGTTFYFSVPRTNFTTNSLLRNSGVLTLAN